MLSDISIARLSQTHGMITPFHAESVSKLEDGTPITSYGNSSYGYDLSLGPTYRRLRSQQELAEMGYSFQGKHQVMLVMDPSNFNPIFYGDVENIPDDGLVLMPGEFILSVSNEYIKMPSDVSAICMQKSTCARTQLRVEVTPLEAGWSGYVTYEICNPTPHPVLLRKGMGITQALFFVGDQPCATTYDDRGGKYQNQPQEPVIPRSKHQQIKGFPYLYSDKGVIKVSHFTLTGTNVETKPQQTRDWPAITANIDNDFHLKLVQSDSISTEAELICKHIVNQTSKEMLEFLKILTNAGPVNGVPMLLSKLFALTDGVLVAIANNDDVTTEIFDSAVAVAHESRLKHDRNYSHVEFLALVGSLTDKVKAKAAKMLHNANGTTATDIKTKEAEPEAQSDTAAFDRDMAAEAEKTKAWYGSARDDVTIEEAIKVIAKAVHADQSYAWTWLCNLAMMAQDAGATNAEANKRAANFLYNIFGYRAWAVNDTYKDHISAQGIEPTFDDQSYRKGIDQEAVQNLIKEARSHGSVAYAKPGSTAAKLGIVPEQPSSHAEAVADQARALQQMAETLSKLTTQPKAVK